MASKILCRQKPEDETAVKRIAESNGNNKKLPERPTLLPGAAESSLALLQMMPQIYRI